VIRSLPIVPLLLAVALSAAETPVADPSADATARAAALMAAGRNDDAVALLDEHLRTTPDDPRARQMLLAAKVAAREAEIRTLISEQVEARGMVGSAPTYLEAKARAGKAIAAQLDLAERLAGDGRLPEAVGVCNAVLRNHPHDPATLDLKYRLLTAMVERERNELLREKTYRRDQAVNGVIENAQFPLERPRVARTVWQFEEDVAEAERQRVRARLQERIDLSYDGVRVREVIEPLFAAVGINYIILDSALGEETLTIHMVDATVQSALDTIAKLVKVTFNYSGGTVYIGGADDAVMVTEIVRLESGLVDVEAAPQMNNFNGGGQGGQGGQQGQQGQQGAGQASSELERFLAKLPDIVVGWTGDCKWYLEKKSNTVYLRAPPNVITEVKRLLRALDYNSVQVLIETRFLEVSEEALTSLGVDWKGAVANRTTSLGGVTDLGAPVLAAPNVPVTPAAAGAGGLVAQVMNVGSNFGLSAAISALETQKKLDTLSAPKILTVNNAIGLIEVSREIAYVSDVENRASSTAAVYDGGTVNSSIPLPVPRYSREKEGIALRIRPSIARNSDVITLSLAPVVREVELLPDSVAQPVPGTNITIQQPTFKERALATTMHIRNGDTVALGGLMNETDRKDRTGIPGASDAPMLGWLFGKKEKESKRRNLVILVTATIVDPTGAKVGEEIRRLRDVAQVTLTAEAQAELEQRDQAEAAAREAARQEGAKRPLPGDMTKGRAPR
jgi:type II secretory pathway component GspD/PulD (secretin)